MMAKLNGSPLRSTEGDLRISPRNGRKSLSEFVYSAMSAVATMRVLKQVNPKSATFTQGNFCGRASSNNISAGRLNELSMELSMLLLFLRVGLGLLQRLQVFAWLESHGLSGRD